MVKTKTQNRLADAGGNGSAHAGREVTIKAPNMQRIELVIVGTAPYVQSRFSKKAMDTIKAKQALGSKQAKKKTEKEPRDFDADYQNAMHKSTEGWCGIPAGAFRNAMVRACSLCGLQMTTAKLCVFVEADGFDAVDGTPLVRLHGEPERLDMYARNDSGVCDIRVRPMWREWSATVRIRFDSDMLLIEDVCNLMARVGMQVGIGEGRPFSRDSCGMGWGLFDVQRERKEDTAG